VRLFEITPARLTAGLVVLALLLVAGLWAAARHLAPPPPKAVVMSTGAADGAYHAFAQRYRAVLARHGVDLRLVPSKGAMENLERLKRKEATLALVQGGLATAESAPGIETLGSMFYEPLWLFYRGDAELRDEARLRGKRIAIGVPGSGTRAVAVKVLALNGLDQPPTATVDLGGVDAAAALEAGRVDAAFFISAVEAPAIARLLGTPGVRLFGMTHIEAHVHRLPFLHARTLYAGVVDLQRSIPPADVRLLAVTANLLADENTHPAIVDLMLEAAREVHGGRGLLNELGDFPAPRDADFPLSADADRYYTRGPPVLRRYLPFWAAVWIERTFFFVVPLLVIAIPVFRYFPALWRWRVRRNVYRWYGELKDLERAALRGEGDPAAQLAELEAMEERLNRVWVPLSFASELYTLRAHVRMVTEMLRRRITGVGAGQNLPIDGTEAAGDD